MQSSLDNMINENHIINKMKVTNNIKTNEELINNIRSYVIDISNSTLNDRLKLRSIMELLQEKIYIITSAFNEGTKSTSFGFGSRNEWAGGGRRANISLFDFLDKFKIKVRKSKHKKSRNKQ